MKCDTAQQQPNRFFEVAECGAEGIYLNLVGAVVKPLVNEDRNFLVVKGNGVYLRGEKVYLFTPKLRPLNIKDQQKIELDIVNQRRKHGTA